MEEKIIKLIVNEAEYAKVNDTYVLDGSQVQYLVQEIVKLFAIPHVSDMACDHSEDRSYPHENGYFCVKCGEWIENKQIKPNVSSSKRIYISGKITGLDITEATKKFKNAEHYLMTNYDNIEIVNPMREVPYKKEKTWEQYMLEDINLLFGCDSIFMLDNWKNSKGARIEYNIAKEMSKTILFQSMFANEYY